LAGVLVFLLLEAFLANRVGGQTAPKTGTQEA
jgi:hypothetical protein